jgi:hypothetical protein
MNLQSLKSLVKNEKSRHSRGKITKNTANLIQNKPNLKNTNISVSSFKTSKYEILPAWRSEKQTRYKANSNPICGMAKFVLSSLMTSKYVKSEVLAEKNKPKTKPNFILDSSSPCFSVGGQTQKRYDIRTRPLV